METDIKVILKELQEFRVAVSLILQTQGDIIPGLNKEVFNAHWVRTILNRWKLGVLR